MAELFPWSGFAAKYTDIWEHDTAEIQDCRVHRVAPKGGFKQAGTRGKQDIVCSGCTRFPQLPAIHATGHFGFKQLRPCLLAWQVPVAPYELSPSSVLSRAEWCRMPAMCAGQRLCSLCMRKHGTGVLRVPVAQRCPGLLDSTHAFCLVSLEVVFVACWLMYRHPMLCCVRPCARALRACVVSNAGGVGAENFARGALVGFLVTCWACELLVTCWVCERARPVGLMSPDGLLSGMRNQVTRS